eukprot:3513326-Rhodomonas_salina.4
MLPAGVVQHSLADVCASWSAGDENESMCHVGALCYPSSELPVHHFKQQRNSYFQERAGFYLLFLSSGALAGDELDENLSSRASLAGENLEDKENAQDERNKQSPIAAMFPRLETPLRGTISPD